MLVYSCITFLFNHFFLYSLLIFLFLSPNFRPLTYLHFHLNLSFISLFMSTFPIPPSCLFSSFHIYISILHRYFNPFFSSLLTSHVSKTLPFNVTHRLPFIPYLNIYCFPFPLRNFCVPSTFITFSFSSFPFFLQSC